MKPRGASLRRLWAQGAARLLPPGSDAASEEFCVLRVDRPGPVRLGVPRQIEVLEYLLEHGREPPQPIRALGQGVGAPCSRC